MLFGLLRFFTFDRYDGMRMFIFLFSLFLTFFTSFYYLFLYFNFVYGEDLEEEVEDEDYVLTRELENDPQEDPYGELESFEEEIEILDFSDDPYLHIPTHPIPSYNNLDTSFYDMNLRAIKFAVYDGDFVAYNNKEFMRLFDC